jgi:hypothetical protein
MIWTDIGFERMAPLQAQQSSEAGQVLPAQRLYPTGERALSACRTVASFNKLYPLYRRPERDLLGLTWPFVDLDAGRVTVAHTLADDGPLAEPKRERSRRTIVLPTAAISTLRAHKAAQAETRLSKAPLYQDQGFVFADELGDRGSSIARHAFFGESLNTAD